MLIDARRTWRAGAFRLGIAAADGALGRVAVRSNEDERASELIDRSLRVFTEMGATSWVAEIAAHGVEADLFAGRWHEVVSATDGVNPAGGDGQDGALASKLLRFRGVALAALDDAGAMTSLTSAVTMAADAGATYEHALALLERSRVSGNDGAQADRETATRELERLGVVDSSVLVATY